MKIRKLRNPAARFVMVANTVAQDTRISSRALGLLVRLLSYPDGWHTTSERLAETYPEGRDAVRTALRELEAAGYLVYTKQQDAAGRWSTTVDVYAEPVGNVVDKHGTLSTADA